MNTFECPFSLHSRKSPSSIALISTEKKWSYFECEELISGAVNALKSLGIKKGDPVAILPKISFETPLIFFALFRIGAIVCPLNAYLPIDSIPERLDEIKTSVLIHADDAPIPNVKQIKVSFSKVLEKAQNSGRSLLEKNSLATYLFTSGTTSKPKIACHSLGNHYYSALGSNAYIPIHEGDINLLSLPLYHIAGIAILFRTFLAKGAVALSDQVKGITHASMVPTQLHRLLKKEALPNYKHILLGGAIIPPSLFKESKERNLSVHPTYGMTEMSSQIATHLDDRPFSLGYPLPYRELKISSQGEIWVKGKTLFKGYLQEDGSLDLPLNNQGYFETSDLGAYSPSAGLLVKGRKDRQFISGGENIQPEEIERHLKGLEGISFAEVVPKPDVEFGFIPTAYIEKTKALEDAEIKEYLSLFLPKFKIPTSFHDASERTRTYKQM